MAIGGAAETKTRNNRIHLYMGGRVIGSRAFVNNSRQDHKRVIVELLGDCEITWMSDTATGYKWMVVVP